MVLLNLIEMFRNLREEEEKYICEVRFGKEVCVCVRYLPPPLLPPPPIHKFLLWAGEKFFMGKVFFSS